MELRVLKYFLAVAREGSILRAAKSLHLSQPTLSTQLKNLEKELGKQLLVRGTKGSRQITLTGEGMILRKRAEEILHLVRQTEEEIVMSEDTIAGNIFIGAAETAGVRFLTRAQYQIQQQYPLIRFHVESGDKTTILENLEKGLIEFGLVIGDIDASKYESLRLPYEDTWGVLMRKKDPLARYPYIHPVDLWDQPLIFSRQEETEGTLLSWFQRENGGLNKVATYNLLYNGSLMVEEGIGYALCLEHIIHVSSDSPLCFRPLYPMMKSQVQIIWKKYAPFSKAASKYFEEIQKVCSTEHEKALI